MDWFSLAVQAADGKNKNLLRHTDLVFRADLVQTVSDFRAEISVHESLIFVPRRVFASIQFPRGYSTYVLNSKTPDFSISGVLFYHISHQTLQSLIFHHFSSFFNIICYVAGSLHRFSPSQTPHSYLLLSFLYENRFFPLYYRIGKLCSVRNNI